MIIGHKEIIDSLNNDIKNNRLKHSYIFSGIDGIGKKKIAIEFAKKVMCKNELDETKIENNNHPDFNIIFPDEKGTIKIESIRELISDVSVKPIESEYKIYIIDEADKITKQGQNALLKTLEEPPKYVLIILITSNYYGIIDTIRSRSTQNSFNKLEKIEIREYLKSNNIQITINEDIFMELVNGSIGEVDKVLKNQEIIKELINFNNKINKLSLIDIQELIKKITENKENINEILKYMEKIYFLNLKNNGNDNKNMKKISNCIKIVETTKNYMKSNINFDICLDYLFNTIWEEYNV